MSASLNQQFDRLFNRLQRRSRLLHSTLLQEKEQYNRLMARFIDSTTSDIYWRKRARHLLELTQRYRILFIRKEEYIKTLEAKSVQREENLNTLDEKYAKLYQINQLLSQKQVLQQVQIKHYEDELHNHDRRLKCVICKERPVNAIIKPCHHGNFCKECIQRINQNTCPLCRRDIESVQEYFL